MHSINKTPNWEYDSNQLSWERGVFYNSLKSRFWKLTGQSVDVLKNTKGIDPEFCFEVLQVSLGSLNENLLRRLLSRPCSCAGSLVNYNGRFDLLEQPWVTFGLRTIESSLALENGDLKLMDQALAKPHYFKILDSLELLRGCCAEAWEEVTGLLTTCVFVQSTSLRSSSVPSTFGAIYISPKHDWVIPNYIDLLVHESSHYSLYIKSKLAKFLNNPTQLAKSPLRDDRRPLIAVLHAVYVLVRVSFVLKRWIELDYPNRDVASELYEQYRLKAKHGLTVLHDTGEWTVDGVELLRNFDKSVGSITDY